LKFFLPRFFLKLSLELPETPTMVPQKKREISVQRLRSHSTHSYQEGESDRPEQQEQQREQETEQMKERTREYRQREEELKKILFDEQTRLAEEFTKTKTLQKELEEARKPERTAPQKVELSRLRAELANLQQENNNLRRQATPIAVPAPVPTLTSIPTPVVNWRPRGDHPTDKLSGSKVEEYRPWRFQIDAKFITDSPLYPDERSKIYYALTQMKNPIFSAMQEWAIVQVSYQLDNLMEEIELYMGVQFQEHEAERKLLTITQKDKESITEYYHRISALWNLTHLSERQRIHKFLTSMRPTISTSLLDRDFTSVTQVLKSGRVVEERRKDIDTNYPRTFNRNRTANQSLSTRQSSDSNRATESPIVRSTTQSTTQPTTRTGSHPNNRFGAITKKPNGWVGNWYNSEDYPKRLTEELKKELTQQGRCWSCRGSGHRGADKVCPRSKNLNSEGIKDILEQSDSATESENE
jgi:hypothetical protein